MIARIEVFIQRFSLLFAPLVVTLAVTGCGAPAPTPVPTLPPGETPLVALASPTEFAAPIVASPTEAATPMSEMLSPTPSPTATAAPISLPAALYLLAGEQTNPQIWRLERDGEGYDQITDESAPVEAFDVSPVDESLAYVSGNALLRTDARGNERTLLYSAASTEEGVAALSTPLWSPDGRRVAFRDQGIRLVSAAGGEAEVLLADKLNGGTWGEERYYPQAWSPDGQQLLLYVAEYEGGYLAIYHLADQAFIPVQGLAGFSCCSAAWTADGATLYVTETASWRIEGILWQIDTRTGEATLLLESTSEEMQLYHPHIAQTGELYALKAKPPASDSTIDRSNPPMTAHYVRAEQGGDWDAWEELSPVNVNASFLNWAPDGSGLLFTEGNRDPRVVGPVLWVPFDAPHAIPLPIQGFQPRWGQ